MGENIITGGAGHDVINGGIGSDTAVYSGNYADYSIQSIGDVTVVTDNNTADGDDGQDSLRNIQKLQFADQTVNISVNDYAPVLNAPIVDQAATEDISFNFTVPASTFTDADGNELTYSASYADGSAILAGDWIKFDPNTRIFSGMPLNADVGSISVKVTVNDGLFTASDIFNISVANVNDAPELLTFAGSVDENAAAGTIVGQAVVTDVDAGDNHSYSLVDASGFFEINNTTGQVRVKVGAAINYDPTAQNGPTTQFAISIIVTDAAGASLTQGFSINVVNINEAPTDITFDGSLDVNENVQAHILGNFSVDDPDLHTEPNGEFGQHLLKVYEVIGGTTQAAESSRFEILGGQFKLKDGVSLNYESGETTITLSVKAIDKNGAGLDFSKEFTVTVIDKDDLIYGTAGNDLNLDGESKGPIIFMAAAVMIL